jgi:hypothetical protein
MALLERYRTTSLWLKAAGSLLSAAEDGESAAAEVAADFFSRLQCGFSHLMLSLDALAGLIASPQRAVGGRTTSRSRPHRA